MVSQGCLLGTLVQAPTAELGTGDQELDDAVMSRNAWSHLNVSDAARSVKSSIYWCSMGVLRR